MPSRSTPSLDTTTRVSVPLVRKVAIIGGGASGAITLDSLVQENAFDEIVLFERRNVLGGVWVLDSNPPPASDLIKAGALGNELDPPLENPFRSGNVGKTVRQFPPDQERFEATPAYEGMATNIIENMMTFSDQKLWVEGAENKYVDRSAVREYIEKYIARNKDKDNVRLVLSTTVEDVEKVPRHGEGELSGEPSHLFRITLRQRLEDGTDLWSQEIFDALIVTVGHYHVPFIPNIAGLREVQTKFPGVVRHAKFFRNADDFESKTVVVIGSRSLGSDVTKFAAAKAKAVHQLIRNLEGTRRFSKRDNVHVKPVVEKYEITDDGFDVIFSDGSVVRSPDYVVYATGYQFLYPFLVREYGQVAKDGVIVPDLYQHTFLINEPLITFVGVPIDSISFRAFEYQAIVVARYLSGRISIPAREEQQRWLDARYEEKGLTRAYHTIGAVDALDFMTGLAKLGHSDGHGRQFPVLTAGEVEEYVAAALKLAELWDEPRI